MIRQPEVITRADATAWSSGSQYNEWEYYSVSVSKGSDSVSKAYSVSVSKATLELPTWLTVMRGACVRLNPSM